MRPRLPEGLFASAGGWPNLSICDAPCDKTHDGGVYNDHGSRFGSDKKKKKNYSVPSVGTSCVISPSGHVNEDTCPNKIYIRFT